MIAIQLLHGFTFGAFMVSSVTYLNGVAPRRLRATPLVRSMVEETRLSTRDLIYPMFFCEGADVRQEVSSMPGIYRQSVDEGLREIEEVAP